MAQETPTKKKMPEQAVETQFLPSQSFQDVIPSACATLLIIQDKVIVFLAHRNFQLSTSLIVLQKASSNCFFPPKVASGTPRRYSLKPYQISSFR